MERNSISVHQAMQDGVRSKTDGGIPEEDAREQTEAEIERAINKAYRVAGHPPAEAINEILCVRKYYADYNPPTDQNARNKEAADLLGAKQKKKFSRRKSTRGAHLILHPYDVPTNREAEVFRAFREAAGWKPGRGNKPNLQLLNELMALFIAYESEGIKIPRRHINQKHISDGRLKDILIGHGIIDKNTPPEIISRKAQRYCTRVADKIIPAVKNALA